MALGSVFHGTAVALVSFASFAFLLIILYYLPWRTVLPARAVIRHSGFLATHRGLAAPGLLETEPAFYAIVKEALQPFQQSGISRQDIRRALEAARMRRQDGVYKVRLA
jgi:hypothetical protein